jgi:hypothetical protein
MVTVQTEKVTKATKTTIPLVVSLVEQIIACRKEIDKSFLKMGKLLYKAKKEKEYGVYGNFPTLVESCAQINMSKARKLIDVYETFVMLHKVPTDKLVGIGFARLAIIVNDVQSNPDGLQDALTMAVKSNTETLKDQITYGEASDNMVRIQFTVTETQRAKLDEILEFKGAKRTGKRFDADSRDEAFMMCIDSLLMEMNKNIVYKRKLARALKEGDKKIPMIQMK